MHYVLVHFDLILNNKIIIGVHKINITRSQARRTLSHSQLNPKSHSLHKILTYAVNIEHNLFSDFWDFFSQRKLKGTTSMAMACRSQRKMPRAHIIIFFVYSDSNIWKITLQSSQFFLHVRARCGARTLRLPSSRVAHIFCNCCLATELLCTIWKLDR